MGLVRPKLPKSHLPFLSGKSPIRFSFQLQAKTLATIAETVFVDLIQDEQRGKKIKLQNFGEEMADKVDVNAKWDACLDLTVRRFVYSSLAGAFGGLLLFRTPVTRWASVAFGAGVGIGSAYTECSRIFDESPATLAHLKPSSAPVHDEGGNE